MSDDVKERILNAALKRMVRFGYRKVSMDEIAQDLVMSKNTIYKYFQSKQQIAESIFTRLEEQINQQLLLIEKANKDPFTIISKHTFFIQQQLAPWYAHFLGDIKSEQPVLWKRFIDFRNEKILEIKKLIEKGIKKGELRNVNSAIAVQVYLGAIDSVLNPEFLHEQGISFPQAIEAVLDIWSSGILTKKKTY